MREIEKVCLYILGEKIYVSILKYVSTDAKHSPNYATISGSEAIILNIALKALTKASCLINK